MTCERLRLTVVGGLRLTAIIKARVPNIQFGRRVVQVLVITSCRDGQQIPNSSLVAFIHAVRLAAMQVVGLNGRACHNNVVVVSGARAARRQIGS